MRMIKTEMNKKQEEQGINYTWHSWVIFILEAHKPGCHLPLVFQWVSESRGKCKMDHLTVEKQCGVGSHGKTVAERRRIIREGSKWHVKWYCTPGQQDGGAESGTGILINGLDHFHGTCEKQYTHAHTPVARCHSISIYRRSVSHLQA